MLNLYGAQTLSGYKPLANFQQLLAEVVGKALEHLYRLFAFRERPQMFTLAGSVAANCLLDPVSYRATLLGT